MNNILGREISTKTGEIGIVIEQDEKYIKVEFGDKVRKYQYPGAFEKYLEAVDEDVAQMIIEDAEQMKVNQEARRLEELAKKEEEERLAEAMRLQEERKKAFLNVSEFNKDLLLRLGMYDEYHEVYEDLRDMCSEYGVPCTLDYYDEEKEEQNHLIIKEFEDRLIDFVISKWDTLMEDTIPEQSVLAKRYKETMRFVICREPVRIMKFRYYCLPFNTFLMCIMEIMCESSYMPQETKDRLSIRLKEIYGSSEMASSLPEAIKVNGVLQELIVYKTLYNVSCNIKNHNVEPAIGTLNTDEGNISLPMHYCKDCHKAFIGRESLKFFQKICGDFNVVTSEDSMAYGNLGKSDLYRYGYNVRADGMSRKQRRELLIKIYESGELSDFQIRRDIEKNIFMFKNNKYFRFAVKKWNEDLEFFNQYLLQNR